MADNGLRFQIRHGKTIPENGELKTYELGYLYGTGALYMGTSSGCRRLIPPGLGDHDAYLPLTGGTLTSSVHIRPTTTTDYKVFSVSRQMNFTDDTNYYVNAMSIARDTDNKLVRGSLMLYRKSSLEGIINDNNIISSLKIGLDTEGVSNAWVSGKLLLNSSNYSNYALPKSGGTLTGNLTFSQDSMGVVLQGTNTAISMTNADGTTYKVLYNVKNSNKNVQLNSTGGEIFIGWANTTGIRLGYTTNCPIRLGTGAYGTSLPSSGETGQIFFLKE